MRSCGSRTVDPQLHSHAIISAKVQDETGRWLALDGRFLKYQQRAIGWVYDAALRSELTARLGVAWVDRGEGVFDLACVPETVREAFSSRTAQLEAKLTELVRAWSDAHDGEDPDPRTVAGLEDRGLVVWYDETELRVGDSLRRKIDAGISRSRFGLVVLSKPFFRKGWTSYELDGLVTRSVDGGQVLLPLWHEISKDEVIAASPSLADKVALRTSDYSVEEIADELASVILGGGADDGDDLAL